ncbi:MAG: class II fructose-bisphosphate aldolase [Alphaproteobacteria bacterium]
MPLVSLKPILAEAERRNAACLGLVCLGWEDVRAYASAAEEVGAPLVLSAGPGARAHMPISVWGSMFKAIAEEFSVPVVAHLDHGKSLDECKYALDAGFTSLMIDGSLLSLDDNIKLSSSVCELVVGSDISVEAELGMVGYENGNKSQITRPEEVEKFLSSVNCDCLAVSIGNSHLQVKQKAVIDWAGVSAIRQATDLPLVIHGGSGVKQSDRERLAREFGVRKFNVGTELRQAFGEGLRDYIATEVETFDRIKILTGAANFVSNKASHILKDNWNNDSALKLF